MRHKVLKKEVVALRTVLRDLVRRADAANDRMTSFDDLSDEDAAAIRNRAAAEHLLDVLNTGTAVEMAEVVKDWKEGICRCHIR